jgi:hypothetical protein
MRETRDEGASLLQAPAAAAKEEQLAQHDCASIAGGKSFASGGRLGLA